MIDYLTCSTPMCAFPATLTGADGKRYCGSCFVDCAPKGPPDEPPRRCAGCECLAVDSPRTCACAKSQERHDARRP